MSISIYVSKACAARLATRRVTFTHSMCRMPNVSKTSVYWRTSLIWASGGNLMTFGNKFLMSCEDIKVWSRWLINLLCWRLYSVLTYFHDEWVLFWRRNVRFSAMSLECLYQRMQNGLFFCTWWMPFVIVGWRWWLSRIICLRNSVYHSSFIHACSVQMRTLYLKRKYFSPLN